MRGVKRRRGGGVDYPRVSARVKNKNLVFKKSSKNHVFQFLRGCTLSIAKTYKKLFYFVWFIIARFIILFIDNGPIEFLNSLKPAPTWNPNYKLKFRVEATYIVQGE